MISIDTVTNLDAVIFLLLTISPSLKWDKATLVFTVCLAVITIVEVIYLSSKRFPMTKQDKIWTSGFVLINTAMIAYNITIL